MAKKNNLEEEWVVSKAGGEPELIFGSTVSMMLEEYHVKNKDARYTYKGW